jgi:hypothetical protein
MWRFDERPRLGRRALWLRVERRRASQAAAKRASGIPQKIAFIREGQFIQPQSADSAIE